MIKSLEMFQAAARKFVNKVDAGQARSRVTYAELKDALAQLDFEQGDAVTEIDRAVDNAEIDRAVDNVE